MYHKTSVRKPLIHDICASLLDFLNQLEVILVLNAVLFVRGIVFF